MSETTTCGECGGEGYYWRQMETMCLGCAGTGLKTDKPREPSEVETLRAEVARLLGMVNGPWYLLYGGTSLDGRGPGRYVGRTVDPGAAKAHHDSCRKDPYSTGYVLIVTGDAQVLAGSMTKWPPLPGTETP